MVCARQLRQKDEAAAKRNAEEAYAMAVRKKAREDAAAKKNAKEEEAAAAKKKAEEEAGAAKEKAKKATADKGMERYYLSIPLSAAAKKRGMEAQAAKLRLALEKLETSLALDSE